MTNPICFLHLGEGSRKSLGVFPVSSEDFEKLTLGNLRGTFGRDFNDFSVSVSCFTWFFSFLQLFLCQTGKLLMIMFVFDMFFI